MTVWCRLRRSTILILAATHRIYTQTTECLVWMVCHAMRNEKKNISAGKWLRRLEIQCVSASFECGKYVLVNCTMTFGLENMIKTLDSLTLLYSEGNRRQFVLFSHPVPPWRNGKFVQCVIENSELLHTRFQWDFPAMENGLGCYAQSTVIAWALSHTGRNRNCYVSGVFIRKCAAIVAVGGAVAMRGNLHAKMSNTHAVNNECTLCFWYPFVYSVWLSGVFGMFWWNPK